MGTFPSIENVSLRVCMLSNEGSERPLESTVAREESVRCGCASELVPWGRMLVVSESPSSLVRAPLDTLKAMTCFGAESRSNQPSSL